MESAYARFARLKVLNQMIEAGLVPVFYHADIEVAMKVASSVLAGGCPFLEFANRGDHAREVFTALERCCARELPAMILGVGSVVDAGAASLCINCRANFVVGPILVERRVVPLDVAEVAGRPDHVIPRRPLRLQKPGNVQ
jgi:2-dehydro-3-deoxyphosphogluconate aldolase/(4S)-4-hydroxy-2-oxoglutarate aldolase